MGTREIYKLCCTGPPNQKLHSEDKVLHGNICSCQDHCDEIGELSALTINLPRHLRSLSAEGFGLLGFLPHLRRFAQLASIQGFNFIARGARSLPFWAFMDCS